MKKGMAAILCGCMLTAMLTGCGGTAASTQKPEEVPEKEVQAEEKEEQQSEETRAQEASGEKTLITYLRPGTEVEHNAELVAAINEKLEADGTGLAFDIMYIPSDVFQDKVNMMISAGEEFDLLAVMEDQRPFTAFVANEGIVPITEYVEASENLKRLIPEFMWESATVNGEIYTIPANWCETADQNNCITVRKEKMEEFGLEDPKTKEDLLHMCEVFTEKWEGENKPVIIPMFKEPFNYLFRTMETYPFTVQKDLIFIDQEGNVKNWMETPEFKESAEFFRTLYEKGYVPEDVLSPGWSSWNTMCTGDFIWVDQCQLWDTEQVWDDRIEGDSYLDSIYLNPDAPQFRPNSFRNDTAVSATSAHPAEAVKFMDWMYASQENYDLMVYGVEGLTFTDEGEGFYSKLIPDFEFNADWMIGNMEYERYQKGTYPEFIEIMGTNKPEAVNSVVLNFAFDPANVADEYANCQAEVVQSVYPMKLGIVSYEEGYEDALARMKAAGIDKVVEEYQRQVDEYLGK